MTDKSARAEHYRKKAEEARIIAESMNSAEIKKFLASVSADYMISARLMEHLADPLPAGD